MTYTGSAGIEGFSPQLAWMFRSEAPDTDESEREYLLSQGVSVEIVGFGLFRVTFPTLETRQLYLRSATRTWRIAP